MIPKYLSWDEVDSVLNERDELDKIGKELSSRKISQEELEQRIHEEVERQREARDKEMKRLVPQTGYESGITYHSTDWCGRRKKDREDTNKFIKGVAIATFTLIVIMIISAIAGYPAHYAKYEQACKEERRMELRLEEKRREDQKKMLNKIKHMTTDNLIRKSTVDRYNKWYNANIK